MRLLVPRANPFDAPDDHSPAVARMRPLGLARPRPPTAPVPPRVEEAPVSLDAPAEKPGPDVETRAVAEALAGETAYRAVRMQSLRRGNHARRQAVPSAPPEDPAPHDRRTCLLHTVVQRRKGTMASSQKFELSLSLLPEDAVVCVVLSTAFDRVWTRREPRASPRRPSRNWGRNESPIEATLKG